MQDGSCNGLQHYAALGLDLPGGTAVNLAPADKPQVRYLFLQAPELQGAGNAERWKRGGKEGESTWPPLSGRRWKNHYFDLGFGRLPLSPPHDVVVETGVG